MTLQLQSVASDSPVQIKFGTDGWRAIIAEDFTFANARLVANAIARYVIRSEDPRKGVVIGYDHRFASDTVAAAVTDVITASGTPVWLTDKPCPTPAISLLVRQRYAAGGIVITASHNPYRWNGIKYKASYGSSALPSIVAQIEQELDVATHRATPPLPPRKDLLHTLDPRAPYLDALEKLVDWDRLRKAHFRFVSDPMHGSSAGLLRELFTRNNIHCHEIRGTHDPRFGGANPEPIEPHVRALQDTVVAERCQAGLVTDGDADRLGAVDEHGNFVDPHKIFAILLRWLLERKQWPGDVTRAFNTTNMLDRIAAKHGRKVYEHGIGFKYVCDLMLEKDILIGGEESGGIGITRHLPERDGLLNCLLLANVMADERKTLGELVESLQQEYGEHQYGRIDLHIADSIKNAAIARARAGVEGFAGMPVLRVETLDGIKFYLENPEAKSKQNAAETWLLLRASGTEPLLRIYTESCSKASVAKLLDAGKEFALGSGGA